MDVCLTKYGHCNYVSGKHACIFYDEVSGGSCCQRLSLPLPALAPSRCDCALVPPFSQSTKHYELLNYSEHGTTVDNVLYSCDFSEKTALAPPSSMVAKVQSVISKFWVLRAPSTQEGLLRAWVQGLHMLASGKLCLLDSSSPLSTDTYIASRSSDFTHLPLPWQL